MSSVRAKNRQEHRLTVLDKALDVYEHTSVVIANPKFQEYPALTNKLDNEAVLIYHCVRSANEDLDARIKDEALMRIQLQDEALNHCKWLKTYIMMCKRKFHLRASKVIYWTSLVNKAIEIIKAWQKSEIRRYKETWDVG